MESAEWKKQIVQCCEKAGTYAEFYEPVIDTLASIMEKRDSAQDAFEKAGKKVIIRHTNKSGATNIEQNPILRMINDLNRDALTYWRDLGLTPAGYKKLNADVIEKSSGGGLERLLEKITG